MTAMLQNYSFRSLSHPSAGMTGWLEARAACLSWMLCLSAWQSEVEEFEQKWKNVRLDIPRVDSDQAFVRLADYRRKLGDLRKRMIPDATLAQHFLQVFDRGRMPQDRHVQGTTTSDTTTMRQTSGSLPSRIADARTFADKFAELEKRMGVISEELNDEIPIVIGYVQIEDAKKSRELTELTVALTKSTIQQARWTMVLAFLAAFYLPMTLVTGIFGMNIKEISEDKGPGKEWVFVTWVVTFIITASCIGGYALWSWWQDYEKKMAERKEKATLKGAAKEGREAFKKWRHGKDTGKSKGESDIPA